MEMNIRVPTLIRLLSSAEDITAQYTGKESMLADQSPGVQYLFNQFLRPIIHEGAYSVDNIDLSRFDREELETLWDVYRDRFGPQSDAWNTAERVYQVCLKAPPQTPAVSFI